MNVYEASNNRLEYLFNEFDKILVAFSGGKDSGVLLNLSLDYAKSTNQLHKLHVYNLDYEANYEKTNQYVEETLESLPPEVGRYWLCLPVKAQCATSMFQNHWIPWDKQSEEIWVRSMPDKPYVVNENNAQFDYDDWDYTVQDNFCNWFAGDEKLAVLVGIRMDESLQRRAAITSKQKVNKYKKQNYITKKDNYYIAYPIYDWATEDIWTANAKFGWSYNKIYDLYYQAGLSIHEMRVASPFNDYAQKSLKLYKVLEPNTWSRMVSRVNGVNFTGIYGGTTAMGWKSITKPPHFTWEQYMNFLLNTLPEETRQNYLDKLESSKKSWRTGGARDKELIDQLVAEGAPVIRTGKTNNRGKKDKEVIQFEDYLDDTQVDDFKKVPTYKRMCICIMKNDTTCKYMGFAQTKKELEKRRKAVEYYGRI